MKIAYYCQHVLGVGHFHRSFEICSALTCNHDVTMITGGRRLDLPQGPVRFFQLPGLMMDKTFNNLTPCDINQGIDEVKKERKNLLFQFFEHNHPDIFLVELYPFGRKAFRFELDPVLKSIKNKLLSPCLSLCSLRDILVERSDQKKFEERIITTLNSLFDGLLIHGDQRLVTLEETFTRTSDIAVPIFYTGYVTPKPTADNSRILRKKFALPLDARLIVASIGGGNIGGELLISIAKALELIKDNNVFLQIFTGPYAESALLDELEKFTDKRIRVERFTSQFSDWLAAADLSVSMAGYNTCMNSLAAGVPALLYPFRQNQEQYLRVKKLADQVPFTILQSDDLKPDNLASLVVNQLEKTRFISPVNLDGATNSANIVEQLFSA